jgi:dipeptidase D
VATALEETVASIESAARLAGADFAIVPPVLPPWRVAPDSAALATVQSVYRDLFHRDPKLVTVHAGAESGIVQQRIPGLEIVSLGPGIQGAHMPGERVNIPSVVEFYSLLSEVVQRLAR